MNESTYIYTDITGKEIVDRKRFEIVVSTEFTPQISTGEQADEWRKKLEYRHKKDIIGWAHLGDSKNPEPSFSKVK